MTLNPRENHFDRRVTVTTPLQDAGAYLLTAKMADGNTSYIIMWLADTAIVRKPLPEKMYYFVADAASGKPIAKANMEFFGWRQERRPGKNTPRSYIVLTKNFAEYTDADGQLIIGETEVPRNYQWLITATTPGGRFAYMGFTGVWYSRQHDPEYKATKTFIITDRPVYRPDQMVKYKFWLRHAQYDMEDASQFAGQTIWVEIRNPKNEKLYGATQVADEYGGVKGELKLKEMEMMADQDRKERQLQFEAQLKSAQLNVEATLKERQFNFEAEMAKNELAADVALKHEGNVLTARSKDISSSVQFGGKPG